ncbi:cell wall hydrolase [Sunxiuqinia dokdonensis]|uniref:N-acetylmuramoyl-L-alanine amidase n=2 Tax=Sunxiuqinia dokdonensis TaxID=1409788 RepID=A0A0L8VA34_9BACT|nr:cell wall hydrolase [Sunxiuqinia dokdonensis]
MNISQKLIFVFAGFVFLFSQVAQGTNTPDKPFTVIIDPGHGGKDPGAVFKQIREKDIVLGIGLKLGNYMRENLPDVKIIYTRDRDVFVPLHERAEIANKNKADLFISLHANYCGTPSITGTETFVLGLHRTEENLDVAKKENAVILMEDDYSTTYQGFDPNSSESYIMFEMVQDEHLYQSIDLAAEIQSQFKNRAGRKDRGVKQAGFLVLRRTSMPSVLVEAGFLSNNYEANYMNSDDGQAYLASAIFRAVRDYKKAIDSKSDYKLLASNTTTAAIPAAPKQEMITSESQVDGVYFRIQLAATSKKIEPVAANFKGLKDVERKQMNPVYKYFYGKTSSFEEIQAIKNEIVPLYPDAFIVAFEQDETIPLKKALRKLKP